MRRAIKLKLNKTVQQLVPLFSDPCGLSITGKASVIRKLTQSYRRKLKSVAVQTATDQEHFP